MIVQKSKIKYSKILVTGGAGFIGTNLCTRLLNETANEVICLDNLRTGKKENIEKLFSQKYWPVLHYGETEKIAILNFDFGVP